MKLLMHNLVTRYAKYFAENLGNIREYNKARLLTSF